MKRQFWPGHATRGGVNWRGDARSLLQARAPAAQTDVTHDTRVQRRGAALSGRQTSTGVPVAARVFILSSFPVAAFGLWSLSAPSSW